MFTFTTLKNAHNATQCNAHVMSQNSRGANLAYNRGKTRRVWWKWSKTNKF